MRKQFDTFALPKKMTETQYKQNNFDSISTFKCFACRQNRAKYRCPGCDTPTCSLQCVDKHKRLLECDGIRDKVKFRRMEQFTNLDVLSDYRLMEEITRHKEGVKRKRIRCRPIDFRKTNLRDNVKSFSNLTLRLLPATFARSKRNNSRWDSQKLFARWKLTWDLKGMKVDSNSPVADQVILKAALKFALGQLNQVDRAKWPRVISEETVRVSLKQELGNFEHDLTTTTTTGNGSTQSMISCTMVPCNLKTSIASNLRDKTIIEHPVFVVERLEGIEMEGVNQTEDEDEDMIDDEEEHEEDEEEGSEDEEEEEEDEGSGGKVKKPDEDTVLDGLELEELDSKDKLEDGKDDLEGVKDDFEDGKKNSELTFDDSFQTESPTKGMTELR